MKVRTLTGSAVLDENWFVTAVRAVVTVTWAIMDPAPGSGAPAGTSIAGRGEVIRLTKTVRASSLHAPGTSGGRLVSVSGRSGGAQAVRRESLMPDVWLQRSINSPVSSQAAPPAGPG